jgi:hypothetical protein
MPKGHVYLFQYGSNMDPDRLNSSDRLNHAAEVVGVGRLNEWGVIFDLYSVTNKCGVTDIVERTDQHVLGIVYRVRADLVYARPGERSKMDKIEDARPDGQGNYQRRAVVILVDGRRLDAVDVRRNEGRQATVPGQND